MSRLSCVLLLASCLAMLSAAESAGHQDAPVNADKSTLHPIAETLAAVKLDALAALPVQNGGRYKPFHSLAMEMIDGVNGSNNLGGGHTPLTSMLDLLFCSSAYLDQPIVVIKHSEVCRDLSQSVPEGERDALVKRGRISPRRLADEGVQAAIEVLRRQTTKTKALNQVLSARSILDNRNLVAQLRCFPLPSGEHSDRWRDPNEIGGDFSAALGDFVRMARDESALATHRGEGVSDAFAKLTWTRLPLTAETAARLGFGPEDTQHINIDVLWPLWQAAATGKLADAPTNDPAALVAKAGLDQTQSETVTQGLRLLAAVWPRLGVADEDLAKNDERAAAATAVTHAAAAWNRLGEAWAAQRTGVGSPAELQKCVDGFVAAVGEIRALDDRDRAARGLAVLRFDTDLEMTYWKFNGFSGVAWLFLCAVPLLALGAIGRIRIALWLGYALFVAGFGGQVAAFIIRGILAQRIPLANLYESMAAASLLCSLVALIGETVALLRRRRPALAAGADVNPAYAAPGATGALALGAALFGCIVVIAQVFLEYHDINAFISPQMPILSEFWLRVHTSCVVSSYGLIGLGGLMSLSYLLMRVWLPWDDSRSLAWDRTTFAINAMATVVLWVGLCLGAVWAAESWGRPWGWDPKEVFALLTWVVFIMLVHLRVAVKPRNRGIATAWVSVAAFAVMAFNWYVVNVVLAGLHSYA